jgi:hypothetical protein
MQNTGVIKFSSKVYIRAFINFLHKNNAFDKYMKYLCETGKYNSFEKYTDIYSNNFDSLISNAFSWNDTAENWTYWAGLSSDWYRAIRNNLKEYLIKSVDNIKFI